MPKILKILIVVSASFLKCIGSDCQKASKYNVYAKAVFVTGGYQVKKYVSYNQVQEKDYKGTGSWQKFPCSSCPVIIIKIDSLRNAEKVFTIERRQKQKKDTSLSKLGAFITYTDLKGTFECSLHDFKIGQEVYVLYNSSVAKKRILKLSEKTNAGIYIEN